MYLSNMGKVLIFSGPSGVGKGTIISYLRSNNPDLFADIITATSRKPRENQGVMEQDGVDYHFFSPEEFKGKIESGYFAEYEEVYPDKFYGTPIKSIEAIFKSNHLGTMDIDYKGALNLKTMYPDSIVTIFIKPRDFDQLRERIRSRNPAIEEHDIDFRLYRAREELEVANQFDYVVTNDDWTGTQEQLNELITKITNTEHERINYTKFNQGLS